MEPSSGKSEYVAGTTWVFDDFSTADGELVLNSKTGEGVNTTAGMGTSESRPGTEEDELDSFMEDLEGVVDI